jgi:hypothetical protein
MSQYHAHRIHTVFMGAYTSPRIRQVYVSAWSYNLSNCYIYMTPIQMLRYMDGNKV